MRPEGKAPTLISILSPVFNEANHIGEMLGSVYNQDHAEWELLFVDDGSTDTTAVMIERAASLDPRIQLLSRDRKLGKVPAFNLAYAHSKGDLIVLLAGDDRLPRDSLSTREAALAPHIAKRAVGFFKLVTFSDDSRFDGMELPRGNAVSRSGGSMIMTRALADKVFPIAEDLVAEDLWLGHVAPALADEVIETPRVVLEYRIHPGNSNPRQRPFPEMSRGMRARHRAFAALLDCQRFSLPQDVRALLTANWAAEQARFRGDVVGIMRTPGLSLADRIGYASMSTPALYWVRSRFYRFLSGRRRA